MSKADEMLKELGYVKVKNHAWGIEYKKEFKLKNPRYIIFTPDKEVVVCEKNERGLVVRRDYFGMQELIAINKKCEELGWLDDSIDLIKRLEKIKLERDYYKLRFEELNKHWNNIIDEIIGEDYYNLGCSWDICDNLTEEDLLYAYNHTTRFKRFIKKLKKNKKYEKIIKIFLKC